MADLTLQEARRRQLIEKLCRHALEYYAEDGTFHGPFTQPDDRDKYRLAAVLMDHGGAAEQRLAETLIRHTFGGPEHDRTLCPETWDAEYIPVHQHVPDWDIFLNNIGALILAKHTGRLAEDVREKLIRMTKRNFSRVIGDARMDFIFHGANDNMPAHATAGLIIGGEHLGDAQAIRDGRFRLQLFAEMLSRRGLCSEFGSGTYLPGTIQGIAEIVEMSTDPAMRTMALQIEQQLWADVACHYHPGSGKSAGPQTRAYTVNTIQHLDCLMLLLWTVTGEPSFCDGVRDIITLQPKQVTHFEGDAFKTACGLVYAMSTTFHFPEHLLPLLEARQYPYRFFASAEHIYADHCDLGGRTTHSTVYQTPDYSLATSDHGFLSGNQSEKLRIAYRRVPEPQSFHDTGILYARYLYNDEQPGVLAYLDNCAPGEYGLLQDHALVRTLQHDDVAVYVSRAENHTAIPATVHRLRQTIILPAHYHDVAAAYIGETRIEGFSGASATPAPVFLDLGQLYLALYPLAMTNHGRDDLIRLEQVGNYRIISFYNYEGPEREFDAATLRETFNGFIVQVSGPAESGSFDAFRASWTIDLLEDWWLSGNRRTRVITRGHELLLNWSTFSDTVRSETIDGREPRRERLWATGMDAANFPLLSGRYTPMPDVLHYDDLGVYTYPDNHWQIGERIIK